MEATLALTHKWGVKHLAEQAASAKPGHHSPDHGRPSRDSTAGWGREAGAGTLSVCSRAFH